MIGLLPDLPPRVAGFRATGEVTKDDYEQVVYPEVRRHSAISRDLSFVFYVDTPLKNFSAGAWIRDIWLGLKGLAIWQKVAIISDVERVRSFTNSINRLLPGEYRGFAPEQLDEAIRWAAETADKRGKAVVERVEEGVPVRIAGLLPAQVRGSSSMTSSSVTAGRESDGRAIYERASLRLMDVNQWTDHCGALAAGFQLTDDTGEPLEGRAAVGDYIRIDIPGPGSAEERGYDWVRIEKIDRDKEPGISLLEVRPCHDPRRKDSDVTAHFLEDSATSTLVIELDGKKVSASVFGRNEVPNTAGPDVAGAARNEAAGGLGAIGLSKIQWKALVQGLLQKD